jgi:hypothetical protein
VADAGRRPESEPEPAPNRAPAPQPRPDADQIAWRVLADLCRPDGAFSRFAPHELQQVIGLRLAEEATRHGVPVEALAAAFERALHELLPRPAPPPDPAAPTDA